MNGIEEPRQAAEETDTKTEADKAHEAYEEAKPEIEGFLELTETILDEQGDKVSEILAKGAKVFTDAIVRGAREISEDSELIKAQAQARAAYLAQVYTSLKTAIDEHAALELTKVEAGRR